MIGNSYLQRRIDHHHALSQRFMGDPVIYRPGGDPAGDFALSSVNTRRYVEGNEVQAVHPVAGLTVSEINNELGRDPTKGDQLIIYGVIYSVIEFQPDGRDDAKLVLHRTT